MTDRPTIIIGLTGPIGCGKSTIAGWLGDQGAVVIDADQVARDVTPPGSEVLARIAAAFGPGVIRPDGSLDRAGLGRRVFTDPDALTRLEMIVHPAVRSRILALITAAEAARVSPVVVIEAIKLVEGGLSELCDDVWLVTCDPAVQLARLRARALERGEDADEAVARVAAQGDIATRLRPHATVVIDASGGKAATLDHVARRWTGLLN